MIFIAIGNCAATAKATHRQEKVVSNERKHDGLEVWEVVTAMTATHTVSSTLFGVCFEKYILVVRAQVLDHLLVQCAVLQSTFSQPAAPNSR